VEVLGEGGMGTVWLGHPFDDPEQLYAVKTVSAQYASDGRVCTMFVKEASLAASIDHPNVVRLFDVGLHEDVPFFVMEWIDGYSLREIARVVTDSGERVPPSIALRIASDLCGGLHAAHELRGDDGQELGLVHRDVSPHNVLVTRDGIAKLIDFGVAKARDLATGKDASVCGGLKGKVRYMAPEQALEKEIDRRADLFSVGAVVYQLLTGRAPFEGPNELAIINALLSTNPVYVPDTLPEPVQWILRRALSRKPEQRFADAAEMQNAIELALVELGQPDSHADVAACLAWLSGEEDDDEEETSERRLPLDSEIDVGTERRKLDIGHPSPPLAFAMPTVDSIPARQSELPDDIDLASRQAPGSSPWRFVLLAAAFVGLLGVGAALLVHETPTKKTAEASEPIEIDDVPGPTSTSSSTSVSLPSGASTTTPIIDFGDVDDGKPSSASRRPRVRRPPVSGAPPPPPPSPPPAAPAKSGDLAGPIKVWK
jgi:eukaryotic-like serine/threonine-protein kinase